MDWTEVNRRRDIMERAVLEYIESKTGLDVYQNYIPATISEDEFAAENGNDAWTNMCEELANTFDIDTEEYSLTEMANLEIFLS